jgi:hypothetical protein
MEHFAECGLPFRQAGNLYIVGEIVSDRQQIPEY